MLFNELDLWFGQRSTRVQGVGSARLDLATEELLIVVDTAAYDADALRPVVGTPGSSARLERVMAIVNRTVVFNVSRPEIVLGPGVFVLGGRRTR